MFMLIIFNVQSFLLNRLNSWMKYPNHKNLGSGETIHFFLIGPILMLINIIGHQENLKNYVVSLSSFIDACNIELNKQSK